MKTIIIRLNPKGNISKKDIKKIEKLYEQKISFNIRFLNSKYKPK
jgi:hypothetical protein